MGQRHRTRLGLALGLAGCGPLDAEAPVLVLAAPTEQRGILAFEIEARDAEPGLARVEVQVDDGTWETVALPGSRGLQWLLDSRTLPDGEHTLRARATDHAWQPNTTETTVSFAVDNTPPALTVAPLSRTAAPATVLGLLVESSEPLVAPTAAGLGQEVALVPAEVEGWWRGLLGVPIDTEPGAQTVVLRGTDVAGNTVQQDISVEILRRSFPRGGTIRLSKKQTAARKDRAAIDQMRATRDAAYTWWTPEQLWEGAMQRPIDGGRRTSPFGRYRTYSDGRKSHHLGTDLAHARGTPVHASNAGIVKAAGWQHLFGNAIIINHGQSLATSYNHLDSLAVEVGDTVEKGQLIGTLGSTGQSTGPHLHWGMQVGLVEVDPESWPAHGFAVGASLGR